MGIQDNALIFSEEQVITASAFADNSLDILQGNITRIRPRDIAPGNNIWWYVFIHETFNNLTSLNVELFTNTIDSFSGAEQLVFDFDILLAELQERTFVINARLPNSRGERFYSPRYSVVGSNPTLGQVTSGFSIADAGVNPLDI